MPAKSSNLTTSTPTVQSGGGTTMSPSNSNFNSAAVASGPASGSVGAPSPSFSGGGSQLAKDRIARFEQELKDVQLLDRMEFVLKKEGGSSARLILETACNRAMFNNQTLKYTLFQKAYFKDSKKDPNADRTTSHTKFTLDMIQKVIYNGANETNLATDQGYNDRTLFMKRFIDSGVTGSWFNLNSGQKVTDPGKINQLSTTPGSGMEEFIYQKCGHGDGRSTAGMRAKEYGIKHGIQPTSPSSFVADTPVPKELESSVKSDLTGESARTVNAENIPVTVTNTDNHGPTVVKNTNDSPKGMFAFPGVGAMVWVFFREGNPLFPVYFAASYSESEWKGAYSGSSLSPDGTNNGSVGNQVSSSLKLNPNAGGGLEFTHIKDNSDPSGAGDKAVAMMYGDDGSNMLFSKGYHQIYTRHDRRDQIDGHYFKIIGGTEEQWIEEDSNTNVRGNLLIKVGKIDAETVEAMKQLTDFSKQMNKMLMNNPGGG
jgi:hypothetical protein